MGLFRSKRSDYSAPPQNDEQVYIVGRKWQVDDESGGMYIWGRDPRRPATTSWTYRPFGEIDMFWSESVWQRAVNELDVDLGLPITWDMWKEEASEYRLKKWGTDRPNIDLEQAIRENLIQVPKGFLT